VGTRIELCGQLAVEIEGTRIEGSLRGRQGRLLPAYLGRIRSATVPWTMPRALLNFAEGPPIRESPSTPHLPAPLRRAQACRPERRVRGGSRDPVRRLSGAGDPP
jgi:hypothetical protein